MRISLGFRTAIAATAVTLLFGACRQDKKPGLTDPDDNGGYASDASRIQMVTDDIISIADKAGTLYNGAYISEASGSGLSGTTVGTDTISPVHTLTIRFGSNNQTCLDGRKRRGTIVVAYTGEYSTPELLHTITFSHYFVNDIEVTGTIKTTRIDTTIAGNWYYNVEVDDTLNMSQDPLQSQYVLWRGNLVRRWVSGFSTLDRNDDAFSVSGGATLTRANGHVFSFGISTPLQTSIGCDFIVSGVANVTGYNGARTVSYGDGSCDANAQLSINPNLYQIKLTK